MTLGGMVTGNSFSDPLYTTVVSILFYKIKCMKIHMYKYNPARKL